ncbi:MAG: sugar transferase [Candidatus Velamenicoccus archaeovorus]
MLRKPLEMDIQVRQVVSRRPPLRGVVPGSDALALLVAVGLSGGRPWVIGWAALTFVLLNVDAARAYRLDPRVGHEIGWLLARITVPLLALISAAALGPLRVVGVVGSVPRIAMAGGVGTVLVLVGRAAAYAIIRLARARGVVSERTLVIGTGRLGLELAEALDEHPEYGLRPIGFIDGPSDPDLPFPLLGGPSDLGAVVEEFDVRRVVVAFGLGSDRDTATLLRELEELAVEVHVVPRFFELGSVPHGSGDHVRGIPLVHLRRPALRRSARLSKRAFDIAVASVMLVLTAPILVLAALAVRVSSRGPILFRQTRVGKRGEPFQILKFRTMYVNDDSDTSWVAPEDQVTPVGRVLRRLSIDELPQLINVLRGDMSMVGPRPERPHFVERFSMEDPRYLHRLRVPGGITGLAQVNGRNRDLESIPERVRFDNSYIEGWSLWSDILIIVRTLALVFNGDRG